MSRPPDQPVAPRLVLASASPRRRELLAALGVPFQVIPADIEEDRAESDAVRLARELALAKARAVASKLPAVDHQPSVVLGSDTVVALDGRILGKPPDAEDARATLRALRGRTHLVVTGIALLNEGRELVNSVTTEVRMRCYSDQEIEAYVARSGLQDGPYDKAGAYAIQDVTFHPVTEIRGCVCSVIGLPLWRVHSLLRSTGIDAAAPALERCNSCPFAV